MSSAKKNDIYKKYSISVILPTYNEKENLPIIIYLLMKTAKEK